MHPCTYTDVYTSGGPQRVYVYVYVYSAVCVCICTCISIHVYVYVYVSIQAGDLSVVRIFVTIECCGVIHLGFGRGRERGERRRVAGRAAAAGGPKTEEYARQEDGAGEAGSEGEGERARAGEGEREREREGGREREGERESERE